MWLYYFWLASITSTVSVIQTASSVSNNYNNNNNKHNHRSGRIIPFPSGAIYQISFGISVAVDTPPNSGQVNFGFQQNIPLPTNLSQLRGRGLGGEKLDRREVYSFLETLLDIHGYHGRHCLLKTFCQLTAAPLAGGLLEDLFTYVFTPTGEMYQDFDLHQQRSMDHCTAQYPLCELELSSYTSLH